MINTRTNPDWSITIMNMIDQWIKDNDNFSDCIKAYDGSFTHEFGTEKVTDYDFEPPENLTIELDYCLPCYCNACGETYENIEDLIFGILDLKNEYNFDDFEMKFSFENKTFFNENLEVQKRVLIITIELVEL